MEFAEGSELLWTDLEEHSGKFTFEDNKISLAEEGKVYYVYLWTRAMKHGIYPDEVLAKLTVANGKLTITDKNGTSLGEVVPPVVYDITLDRTNYATNGYVELFTYNGTSVVESTKVAGTIDMPEGGTVEVVADNEFTVEVTDTDAVVGTVADDADGKYHCVITGINEDTTVKVNEVTYEITFKISDYSDSEVELYAYGIDRDGDTYADSITVDNKKAVIPVDGGVMVFANSEFTVTATNGGEPSTVVPDGTGKYYCVIDGFTDDAEVVVKKYVPTPDPTPAPTSKPSKNDKKEEAKPVEAVKDDVPNTGINNGAMFAFAMMAISGCGVVFYTKRKKAFNKEN